MHGMHGMHVNPESRACGNVQVVQQRAEHVVPNWSQRLPRRGVTPGFALEILTAAADGVDMSPTDLDHAVWQWQRGRR
jgi:hypothetical protein